MKWKKEEDEVPKDSELATTCKVYVSGYCREVMKEMITVIEVDKTYCDIMELSFNYILFDYWLRKKSNRLL